VTAFSQKPNHRNGRKRWVSLSGTPGATPRIRTSTAALRPATIPMPTVWSVKIVGKASTEGESRIHMLKGVVFEPDEEFVHSTALTGRRIQTKRPNHA